MGALAGYPHPGRPLPPRDEPLAQTGSERFVRSARVRQGRPLGTRPRARRHAGTCHRRRHHLGWGSCGRSQGEIRSLPSDLQFPRCLAGTWMIPDGSVDEGGWGGGWGPERNRKEPLECGEGVSILGSSRALSQDTLVTSWPQGIWPPGGPGPAQIHILVPGLLATLGSSPEGLELQLGGVENPDRANPKFTPPNFWVLLPASWVFTPCRLLWSPTD